VPVLDDDPSVFVLVLPSGLACMTFSSGGGDTTVLGVGWCSISKVGLRASNDNLFSLLEVADIGVDDAEVSGDMESRARFGGRAIISGLRVGCRSGSEGTLISSLLLMLIGAPNDVGFTSLAMFLGATGVLYVDEERDDDGRASMVTVCCVWYCVEHTISGDRDATDFAGLFL
jgi:hypothetical protein